VKELFAAIGRGDVKTAFALFDDTIEFQSPVTRHAPPEITWSKVRHGKEEVAAFFAEMGAKMDTEPMQITRLFATKEYAAVEGMNRGTVRATGTKYEHDWVMII
jgi:ketosteroid isomerase-like protein